MTMRDPIDDLYDQLSPTLDAGQVDEVYARELAKAEEAAPDRGLGAEMWAQLRRGLVRVAQGIPQTAIGLPTAAARAGAGAIGLAGEAGGKALGYADRAMRAQAGEQARERVYRERFGDQAVDDALAVRGRPEPMNPEAFTRQPDIMRQVLGEPAEMTPYEATIRRGALAAGVARAGPSAIGEAAGTLAGLPDAAEQVPAVVARMVAEAGPDAALDWLESITPATGLQMRAAQADSTGSLGNFLLASAGSIAENAPQLAVQYATAMLTGGASLAGKATAFAASAFPMEFADSFDSISKGLMEQNPGMTLAQARAKAALWASSVAAVNTMLERVEGGQLFAANPALHDALVRRTMDRAAKNFVVEGVTETMQEGVGAGAEYLSGADPTALDANKLGPRLAIAGVTGGVLGGMGGAVAGAFDHSGEQAGATADPVVDAGKQAAADVKQGMTDEHGPAGTGAAAGAPGVATDAAGSASGPAEPGAVGTGAAGENQGAARRGRHKAGAAEPDGSGGGGGVDAYASMTREELEHTLRNRGDFHVDDKAMATLADDDLRQALREADAMAGVPSPQGTTTSKGKPHGEGQGRQKEQGRPQDEALLNPTGPSAGAATTTAPAPGSVPVGKAPNADRLVTPGGGAEVKPAGDGLENLRLGALVALAEAHGVDPSLDRAGIIDGLRRLGVKSVQAVEDAGDAAPSAVRPKGPDAKTPQHPGNANGQPVARPEAQPIKPGVAGDGTAQGDSPRAGNRTPVHEAIRKQFSDAGPGHAKVSRQIDDMVADGTLDEDNAAIVRSAMADMDDGTLANRINLRSSHIDEKHTGKAIDTRTGHAPTRRTKGAAALVLRGLAKQLAARAAAGKSAAIDWTPSAVTLEEVGHIMVRIVPTEAQTDQMRAEYDSRSPEQWAAEFERDGFDREGAAYAASSYDEWAAHKFYLHALGRVSSNPAVRGVMQRVFNAFKRALQRFAEAAGFVPDHLLPIFEAMRLGKIQTESGRERAAPAPTRGKAQQTTQTLRPEATDDDMPTMGTDGSTRPASAPRGGGEPEPIQAQPPRVEPRPELPQERPAPSTAGQTERPKPPPMRNVVKGRESVVRLADGGELSITYAMVEADELTPSHDARANFAKNEAATINERNYHLPDQSQMSRAQVSRIANSPKPDLLYTDTPSATDGPPIVDSLGRVLGGNARTMGVQLAYFMPGSAGETYRKGAAQAASKFGIDPAAAESFQEPVIVRMLSEQDTESLLRTDDDEVRMSAALNEALTAGKTAETEAVSKAARLSQASINAIIAELDGYETLSEALENAGVQARIIRAMAQSGAWGARDTEAFVSDSKLNGQGRLALESALLGTVIRDVKAMSAIPPSLRNMMVKSVPSMLGIREAFDRPDSDVQFDGLFADAIKALDLARASGSTPLEAATSSLNPAGMDPVLRNPRAVALAEAMHEGVRSPRKFADRMARVVGAIREAANGQIDMMAGRALSPGEAFDLEMGVRELHGRGLFSQDEPDPTEGVPLVEVRHVYGDNGEDRWQLFEKATGQPLGLRFVTLDAARRQARDTNALRREEAIKRAEDAKRRANDVPSVESYVDAPKQPWETDEDYRLRRKWRGAAEDTGTLWGRRMIQDAPGFREWFGDSQIRHGSGGRPKVVYHGTPDAGGDDGQGIQAFDRSKIRPGNLWGQAFYTTDRWDIAGGSDGPVPMQGYAQAGLARSTPDGKRQEAARLIRARLDGLPEPNRRTLSNAVELYESNPETTFRDIEAAAYSAGVDVGDIAAAAGLLQGSGVIPAYLRMERPLRVDSRDEVLAFLRRVMDEGDKLPPSLRAIRDAGGAMIREAMQPGSIARRMLEDNPARFLRRAFGGSNGGLARQIAERLGYDGLIERKSATASVPGHDIYVVFDQDQIKSVFAESFTRGEPRLLHGRALPASSQESSDQVEPHPLVALHNTTVDGLKAALRMGGIPGPSIAILKHGDPFDNYGRVTLIGRRSMIDPQTDSRNKVYGADAYTPNQPPAYHVINPKGYRALRDRIIKETDGLPLSSGHWSTFEDAVNRGNKSQEGGLAAATRWLETELAMKVMYLRELGEKVPIPSTSAVPRGSRARHPKVLAWVKAYLAERQPHDSAHEDTLEPLKKLLGEIGAEELNATLKLDEQLTPKDAEPHWTKVRGVFYNAVDLIANKRVPNVEAVKRNVDRLIKKHGGEAALHAWASKLAATAFTGEQVLKRGRRTEPYTLDNVADAMFSRGSVAAEKNMVYGLGQARASSLAPIDTVHQLHNREHELASKADVEARKESNNQAFFALVERLRPYHRETGFSFEPLDDASRAIGQIIRNFGRAGEFLRRNGFSGVPADIVAEAVQVASLVRGTPTEYFEGKPQRAVRMSEFAAAVMPNDAPEDLDDQLRSHGVEPVRYDPSRKDARRVAVLDAAKRYAAEDRGQDSTLFGRVLDKITQDELGFYSRLEGWVGEKMRGPMPAGQLRVALKNAGLPADEIKWTGIDDWLAEKKGEKVTPDQVREYLSQNKVELKEKVLGGGSDSADMAEAVRKRDAAKQKASRILNQFDGRAAADDELGWQIDKTARFLATNPDGLNERKHIAIEGAIEAMRRPYGEDVRADMDKRGLFAAMREAIEAATDAERLLASRPPSENTKYERFTLPGGENYREVLLTLPSRPDPRDAEREYGPDEEPDLDENDVETVLARDRRIGNFRSSHFSEPNIIAHLRVKDRTTPDGKKVLFAEEFQSDWHEQGRDRGYRDDSETAALKAERAQLDQRAHDLGLMQNVIRDRASMEHPEWAGHVPVDWYTGPGGLEYQALDADRRASTRRREEIDRQLSRSHSAPPPAPWSKTWHEMVLRRAIRLAAQGGYDALGWTTGRTQTERYEGLAEQVEKVEWEKLDDGTSKVFMEIDRNAGIDFEIDHLGRAKNATGHQLADEVNGKQLSEIVGVELAKRIMAEPAGRVRGTDIRIGGDGMRNFYDRDLVNYARKYGKKWGAEPRDGEVMTGPVDHPSGDPSRMKGQGSSPAHLLPITPEMRNSVLEDGQPLFGRFLWDRDDSESKPAAEPTPLSLFDVRRGSPPGASSPSERGAGDAFNAKGGATAPEPPATASHRTGRTGSQETFAADAADAETTAPFGGPEAQSEQAQGKASDDQLKRQLADIAAERSAVDSFIRDRIGPDGGQVVLADGHMFIISRNTIDADKYPWRVTRFVKQPDGQVVAAGHDVARELDNPEERGAYPPGAVQVLAQYIRLSDTIDAPPPPQNKPTLATMPPRASQEAPQVPQVPQPTADPEEPEEIRPYQTTAPKGFSRDRVPKRLGAITHPDRILFDPEAPGVPPGDHAYAMGQGDGLDGLTPEPPPDFASDYQRGYEDGQNERASATATQTADDPKALDGSDNAERANDAVQRRINTLAGKAKVPPAAWKALEDLVHTDPVAAMAYARQKSLEDRPDAIRFGRIADRIAKMFGLQPRKAKMVPAGKGKSGEASEGQRRAKEGGEFGPNGEWYPGGSFINTVRENPKGDGSAPSGTDRPMVEAASDPMRPWLGASVDDESKWFGTRVRVAPELRGESEIGGTIQRVLNGGRLVEVKLDGTDSTFRYPSERVSPIEAAQSIYEGWKPEDAQPIARSIGHPNNSTYIGDIKDAIEGKGTWGTLAQTLARIVGADEAEAGLRKLRSERSADTSPTRDQHMGVPSGMVQSIIRDGKEYRLYADDEGRGASVRIKNLDTHESESQRFASMAEAKAFFDRAIGVRDSSATEKPASGAENDDSDVSRRTDATPAGQAPAPRPEMDHAAATEALRKRGIEVAEKKLPGGRIIHSVTGNTYEHRDAIKSIPGNKPSWYGADKSWSFWNGDPTIALAQALAGSGKGGSGAEPNTGRTDDEDVALREQRERELARPDERPTGESAAGAVQRSTADLIRLGAKAGIPDEVLGWQIEDIGLIRKAFEAKKPAFLLGSAPGSGKTFVIGGAIRELRQSGAERFVWVTMNQTLIEQIKNDLREYGIEGVEFLTYSDLSGASKKGTGGISTAGAVLVLDEAHNVKNETIRGKAAAALITDARFTLFSSATPFENPVQAKYLEPTGLFSGAGGHTNWAILFGAQAVKIKVAAEWGSPGSRFGKREVIVPRWVNTKEAAELAKGAKRWFEKQGILSQRPLKLAPGSVEAAFEKYQASPEYVKLYEDVVAAYDAALAEWQTEGPDGKKQPIDAQTAALISMHQQNAKKRILEGAKTRVSIERIGKIRAEGRRVVVFVETKADRALGRFRKSNDTSGPRYAYPEIAEMMQAWYRAKESARRFGGDAPPRPFAEGIVTIAKAMHEAGLTDAQLPSVTDDILAAVPDALLFTGEVSDARARENLEKWRKTKDGVLLATMHKGGTGLSLHDKIGDYPTSMVVLNMPWTATQLEQVSGRINRYGLRSVAKNLFLFADNIPFERLLASRIGGRLRAMNATVKGLGSEAARSMEDFDFESGQDASHMLLAEKQRAMDGAPSSEPDIDVFDRAAALEKTRLQSPDKDMDYFATPYTLAAMMGHAAGVRAGDRVLEPSAGEGNLLRFLPEGAIVDIVEPHEQRRRMARGVGEQAGLEVSDHAVPFEEFTPSAGYDAVVMNPPFSRVAGKGWQDIAHVRRAWDMLNLSGRLVAIVSEGPFFREDSQSREFRDWLDEIGATVIRLPEGAFKGSGTMVRARLIVADRAGGNGADAELPSIEPGDVRAVSESLPTRPDRLGDDARELHGRAFHGSPHTFDRFDISKIGTGEGAQSYGYGLYFASNREVAEHYRNALSGSRKVDWLLDGKTPAHATNGVSYEEAARQNGITAEEQDALGFIGSERTIDATIKNLRAQAEMTWRGPKARELWSRRADIIERMRDRITLVNSPPGRLYEVDLKPAEDEYLLWDEPISKQSAKVKRALKASGAWDGQREFDTNQDSGAYTGASLYRHLASTRGPTIPAGGGWRSMATASESAASAYLKSLGIRGIKYLDGISRSAGHRFFVVGQDGTLHDKFATREEAEQAIRDRWDLSGAHVEEREPRGYNYVIFDDADVEIEALHGRELSDQTETPAFKRWFGNSKVVDKNGKPLVVYHGTAHDVAVFDKSKIGQRDDGWYGRGFYFTPDAETASSYAESTSDATAGPNVVPVYVAINNPYVWPDGRPVPSNADMRRALHEELVRNGHDGVIVPVHGEPGTIHEVVAFSPTKIKSAIGNRGTFDPNDPNILHGRAITDPPPDDVNKYVKWSESQRALSSTYYEKGADGQWKARTGPDGAPVSSRTTPQAPQPYKVGQWRIDDGMHGIYGHEIAQLREVPLADLTLIEDDYTDPRNNGEGRGDDARRYAEWMREGRQAPPIEVIQHVDGHLVVSNGHRRTAAAKMAGKSTILAWVNPLMPTGEFYTNGKPILTGLTYEGAKYGAPRAYQDWNENVRVGQPATLLGRAMPDDDIPPPPEDAHRVREAEKAVERKARILAEHGDGRVSQVRSTLAYAVGRADTFLRTLGPAGKQLASEAIRIANRSAKRGNTDEADFKHAVKDLNRADREIVAKIGQFRKDPKSGYFYRDLRPDLAKIADGLREIADRSMKMAASLGVERAGKQLRGGGGWYPQVPNAKGRAFMETAFHEGLNDPSVAKWADEQVADGKFRTPDAALGSLMRMRDDRLRGVNRYLESYRTLLPIDCVEWDLFKTVPPLLHKNALLVEAIREWGVKFEGARALIETIAEQAGGHWRRPLKAWLQASFDQYKHNPISRKVFGAWSNFETLGRLAFSPISSLQNYGQQFVNTAIFGYGPLGKALAQYPPLLNHWIESARAVAEKVDRSGATSDIGSIANPEQHGAGWSLAELGLKVGGFVAAERANQVRSAIIAYEGIKADFDRLLRAKSLDAAKGLRRIVEVLASPVRTPTDAVARRVQRFTGMSDAALKSRLLSGQRLTEAELEMVMVRMTRDTQFVQDLASEPAWFRMSPFLRLATKFKTWGTRQVGLVYEHVLKEARRGNFGPLVRLALAAVIAGELVNLLRDLLRGKDESLTAYMVGKRAFTWGDVAQRIVGDMRQGGAFGLLLDMTYGMSNFIGGPALNTFENAGRLAIRLVDKGGKLDADGVLASLDAAATEQLAVKRLADDLVKRYRVSRAGWPDNPMEWRTRTREWLREQKYAGLSDRITGAVRDIVMGRFTIGDSTGSNVLPYRNAAHQIDVGDVDDAADYLYGVLRGVEPAKVKDAIGGIRQSMLAHSPLGAVAKKDLSAFLSQFPDDVRAKALDLHGKWIASYSKAMGEAIRRWSEEHRQPSGSP